MTAINVTHSLAPAAAELRVRTLTGADLAARLPAWLADELDVRYLELRNEWALSHPDLGHSRTDKVHMRLDLPATAGALWDQLNTKVRNQVRKGQKGGFTVHWGGADLLDEFHAVF